MRDDSSPRSMVVWLGRVRQLLRRQILLRAAWMPALEDGPAGRSLVDFIMGRELVDPDSALDLAALDEELDTVAAYLPDPDSVGARWATFAERLEVDALGADALWLLLAPELDSRFLDAYRLIWGDRLQRYCDVDFIRTTLSPGGPYRIGELFSERSPLMALGFVEAVTFGQAQAYRPSRRLLDHLTGIDRLEARFAVLALHAPVQPPAWRGFELSAGSPAHAVLDQWLTSAGVLVVETSRLASLDLLVQQLAAKRRRAVLVLDLTDTFTGDHERDKTVTVADLLMQDDALLLRATLREARLMDAVLLVRGVEALATLATGPCRRLADLLGQVPQPILLECDGPLPSNIVVYVASTTHASLATLAPALGPERLRMWTHLMRKDGPVPDDVLRALAAVPCDAQAMERVRSVHRDTGRPLVEIARRMATRALPQLARRVDAALGWESVVLPKDVMTQIQQVRTLGQNYDLLMSQWGLGRRRTGRGIKVLFSGPSGTGKTLSSALIARDALCDLYQVDISSIVSKWVGETEKHLAQLFRSARGSGAALLFDEADALFRRRSSGGEGSGERFGSQIVNFLLEEVEAFDGMIILTTNLDSAIDPAFERRLHYHVRFVAPDAAARAKLWRIHLPSDMPIAPGVDLDALAQHYELTGGQIEKASIRAAVHALQRDARAVELPDLEAASVSLYVESGRLPPSRSTTLPRMSAVGPPRSPRG